MFCLLWQMNSTLAHMSVGRWSESATETKAHKMNKFIQWFMWKGNTMKTSYATFSHIVLKWARFNSDSASQCGVKTKRVDQYKLEAQYD